MNSKFNVQDSKLELVKTKKASGKPDAFLLIKVRIQSILNLEF